MVRNVVRVVLKLGTVPNGTHYNTDHKSLKVCAVKFMKNS
jgi:hypothetical protein